MLVDFEEEVGNVFVAVGHSLQPLNLVVDALGDGRRDPHQEEVQDEMTLAEELLPNSTKAGILDANAATIHCLSPAWAVLRESDR